MTNEQKQCLLTYLGYYEGSVDGIWGEKSRKAAKAFQHDSGLAEDAAFGADSQRRILEVIASAELPAQNGGADWWEHIRYFTRAEFACKCGRCGGFPAEPAEALVRLADQVREHFGKPAVVSSGIRCPSHNTRVGGVANSYHLKGKAVDFRVSGLPAGQVLTYVKTLPVHYAYAIDGDYVHMDVA
ncbi:MAG: D-Ala-D-Ala carboxypeptidase family metallohydrolase [Faecousia sp.]